ncbi:uncharacterized protein DNG_03723 [Cephalotrichum gorgonifer]|uniref:Telomeric single stranded DNA binding POT1/Cdc13 domain-containing protein n=1 Tax=Cephalotrichum gorgonifer TaxID=2041049 RepID=A0AAE8SUI9_9PEZI|nr:uncharacterized protein DNG_03723 [Cephalotrichum gorgonifer]
MDVEQGSGSLPERDLEAAIVTPIAELGPHLTDTAKRSTRGVITIVWPYSIVTKTLSFILAEPDFRLRLQKGQVRVTFVGPCAKAISDASLGGGDEILLSLDGVEWVENDAPNAAGLGLEWQAKFPSGAFLRVDGEQYKEPRVIHVGPTTNGSLDSEASPPTPTLPEQPIEPSPIRPATPEPILPAKRRIQEDLDGNEYASPAFIKRARVSYGALFDGGLDIFDEDLESSGRGRRRTKFGRDSSAWRYASESRSPEPEVVQTVEEPTDGVLEEVPLDEPPSTGRPSMTDEGCQTLESTLTPPLPTPTLPARHEEQHVVRESEAALGSGTPVGANFSSPVRQQDAVADGLQSDDPGRTSQETLPDGLNHVHIPQAGPLEAGHEVSAISTTSATFQEGDLHPPGLHPPGERGLDLQFGGFGTQPIPWGSHVPYPALDPALQSPHGAPAGPFAQETFQPQSVSPYPDISQPFSSSFHQHHLADPLPPAPGANTTSELAVESQPSGAYLISSDVESIKDDVADGELTGDAEAEVEEENEPMPFEEKIKTLLPQESTNDEAVDAVADPEEPPGPEMTSRVDEELDASEAETFPSDNGDEGGDYDTRNYADLDDDGNTEDEKDVNPDETDEEIYDEDEGSYDEEGEYEDEVEGESDQEEEYDESEGPGQSPAPPASTAPVFIDLISDSEDEAEAQGESAPERGTREEEAEEKVEGQLVYTQEEVMTGEEDGRTDEEEHSENDEEGGITGQEGLEVAEGEDESNDSKIRPRSPGPLSNQHDGADDDAHPSPMAMDQDEAESADVGAEGAEYGTEVAQGENEAADVAESGTADDDGTEMAGAAEIGTEAEDNVDMVSPAPDIVAALSSPPPAVSTPLVAVQGVAPSARMESMEAPLTVDADPQQTVAVLEPSEPAGIPTSDLVQPDTVPATDDIPAREPVSLVEADGKGPAEHSKPGSPPRELSSSVVAEEDVPAERPVQGSPPPQEPVSLVETENGDSTGKSRQGTPHVEPISLGEAGERGFWERSMQSVDKDGDSQMAISAADRHTSQPATSPSRPAPEPMDVDEEDDDKIEVVTTASVPVPVRLSLDEQVQADIERQLQADSSVMDHGDGDAPVDAADETERDSGGAQPRDKAEAVKEISSGPLAGGEEGLASPPLTQQTQPQGLDTTADASHQETPVGSEHPELDQLLTPDATQLASATHSFKETSEVEMDRRDSAESLKVTLGSPTLEPQGSLGTVAAPGGSHQGKVTPETGALSSRPADEAPPPSSAEGFAITVKSLRNRKYRPNLSPEKNETSRRDPSTHLARASLAGRERGESAKRDPSIQLAKSSLAARRGAASVETTPPSARRTTRSRARSTQMSTSPEPQVKSPELGDAGERERESQSILKLQLNKSLRLTLLDLTALKVLHTNVNRKIDVLGVATAQPASPERPKHGPRDYLLSFMMTDQTTAPNHVVVVQVFRPHIESLPVVKEGDVVLLRQFVVTALQGRDFGLRSCETSSWAVWERGRDDGLPQIKGPPAEVSGEEDAQAGLLLKWYAGLDGRTREKLGRANSKMEQEGG